MTIETEHRKSGPFISDGEQLIFPFYFRVFEKKDIVVTVGNDDLDSPDALILNLYSDYDIQFTEGESGGNIMLKAAIPSGKVIAITSDVKELQLAHFTNKGGMFPQIIETAFDKCVVLIQQLTEKVGRSLIMPVTSTGYSPEKFLQDFLTKTDEKISASASLVNEAKESAAVSSASAQEAYQWANMPEDETVPSEAHPGENSAYHHAQKAKQSVQAGITAIAEKTEQAAVSASASAGSAEEAYNWANCGENTLIQTEAHIGYSAYHYAQKAKENADAAASAIMPGSLVGQLFYGQIVLSAVPIESSGLCLLNGQQLQKGGRHDKFISHIAGLKDRHPGLFVTETAWWATIGEYGSCGKFVLGEDSLRLPKISDILQCTTDLAACGDIVAAGLPNITGEWTLGAGGLNFGYTALATGAIRGFNPRYATHNYADLLSKDAADSGFSFNASRSSSLYGASDTVQPQTLKVLAYIVVDAVDVDALNALLKTVNEKGEAGQVLVKGEAGLEWASSGNYADTILLTDSVTLTAADCGKAFLLGA
ncbi:MAG: hypothetical protein NC112_09685, partial [Oxalobacter formigenes]|nr:hypothetical protein [Oxalobacter formigenes]